MSRVKARSLGLREAAESLELSYRQAKRIWARYRDGGAKALQHGNCGRVSNQAYTRKFRAAVDETSWAVAEATAAEAVSAAAGSQGALWGAGADGRELS